MDEKLGMIETEDIISSSNLESEGAYSSTGNYSSQEIHQLLDEIQKRTQLTDEQLQEEFGNFLFTQFLDKYAGIISKYDNTFDLMKNINDEIHLEAKKIYPHTRYPQFDYEAEKPDQIRLVYSSNRNMPYMAKGMIQATIKHFGEEIDIKVTPLDNDNKDFEFILTKNS